MHSLRITYLENGIHLCLFELMPFSISPDYTQDGRLHSSHCPIIFGDRCCGYLAVPCHLLYSVQLTIQLSTLYLLKRGGVATCNTLGRNISLLQIELPILLWNKLVGYSLRTLHWIEAWILAFRVDTKKWCRWTDFWLCCWLCSRFTHQSQEQKTVQMMLMIIKTETITSSTGPNMPFFQSDALFSKSFPVCCLNKDPSSVA